MNYHILSYIGCIIIENVISLHPITCAYLDLDKNTCTFQEDPGKIVGVFGITRYPVAVCCKPNND